MESVAEFKKSCFCVSKAFKRINLYVTCAFCGNLVIRFPSQRKSKLNFCCRSHAASYYNAQRKLTQKTQFNCFSRWHQSAFYVNLTIARALVTGVYPKEANFR